MHSFRLLVGKAVGEVDVYFWMLHGIHHQGYAGYDERDGKPLAHIECHGGFEVNLIILDELDEESGHEYAYEEHSEYQSRTLLGILLPVHPH